MRIIVIAITLITLIAVVVVSILYGIDLFIPGTKPTPTPTPTPTVALMPAPTPTAINTSTVTDYVSLLDNLHEAQEPVMEGFIC